VVLQVTTVVFGSGSIKTEAPKESRTKTKATASRISPRHAAWLMLKEPESAKSYLEHLYRTSPEIAKLAQVAREFFRIVRHRDLQAWVPWLASTEGTPLAAFASSLLRDRQAVMAALQMPWSNGQSKDKYIDSSSSSDKCMGAQASICLSCVSCKRLTHPPTKSYIRQQHRPSPQCDEEPR